MRLWRKAKESPAFKDGLWRTFCYCLLEADHEPRKIEFGGKEMMLAAGSFTTGRYKFAKEQGLKPTTAWKRLLKLEKLKMVTLNSGTRYTIVRVCNWARYQGPKAPPVSQDSDMAGDTTGGTVGVTLQEPKEPIKNPRSNIYSPFFEEVWKIYPRKIGKRKAAKCANRLLKDGAPQASVLKAAQNYAAWTLTQQKEPAFIKHPSTFYGPDGHWEEWVKGTPEGEASIVPQKENTIEKLERLERERHANAGA